jgi:hypothetical protein
MTLRTRIKLGLTAFTLLVVLGVLGLLSGQNAEAIYCCEDCNPNCDAYCVSVCCWGQSCTPNCHLCMAACESEYERCSTHCVYCNS